MTEPVPLDPPVFSAGNARSAHCRLRPSHFRKRRTPGAVEVASCLTDADRDGSRRTVCESATALTPKRMHQRLSWHYLRWLHSAEPSNSDMKKNSPPTRNRFDRDQIVGVGYDRRSHGSSARIG